MEKFGKFNKYAAARRDPEQFRIPRSVQEVIPIRTVWKSGIFLVGPNRYSRTWQFSDINYALAGEEDQKSMLLGYSGLLNLCDSNASTESRTAGERILSGSQTCRRES